MKRQYVVRVTQPARPAVSPAKVVMLASRRQARLERIDPKPPKAA